MLFHTVSGIHYRTGLFVVTGYMYELIPGFRLSLAAIRIVSLLSKIEGVQQNDLMNLPRN
ncbi:hypothetical protein [Domibacillus iocasae]|uniref:hypothetical protein n=1 Tax=Domibacillus iocasae TaxID=1714016 RepID=UPI00114CA912|nr:hypothetical protein [Domibacillus iocasae]